MRILVFLLFISSVMHAQENDPLPADILLLKNDTEQVNRLYKHGFNIRNTDPQTSFKEAKLCEKAALRSGSEKHLAKSYNLLGILYYKKGNFKTALAYHTQALQLRKKRGDHTAAGDSEVNLGNIYSDLQWFEKAESTYLSAIDAYKLSGNNNERIADCLLNIGVLKHQQKQYDQAIENYKLAEQLTGLNDYNTKAIFLTNMAEACKAKGELDQCITYNEDALKLRIMADNTLETADNYLNLGSAYLVLNDLLKVSYYLDTAYYIANKNNYFDLKYEASKEYALYYARIKNFEQAFYWQQLHNTLKDTLALQQSETKQLLDFDELQHPAENMQASAGINNLWLLISVFSLIIFIPLSLIRFKR